MKGARTSQSDRPRPLRIALVAPPFLQIPPSGYGGTERVVGTLAEALHLRGHEVTLYAAGDSRLSVPVVAIEPTALWAGHGGGLADPGAAYERAFTDLARRCNAFDVVHLHIEEAGFGWAAASSTPVVTTLHRPLDRPLLLAAHARHPDVRLVAISQHQRSTLPAAHWLGVVHNGLDLSGSPFRPEPGSYLAFVGRAAPEKGLAEAIAVARTSGLPLRIAAKVLDPTERAYFDAAVRPALGRGDAEFLGELDATARDQLLAGARATLMLGRWPEPFGLVAIESLATGTPVIARRAGALPEIVRDGVDGIIVGPDDDPIDALARVATLDRTAIREDVLRRFSADRMTDDYESIYRALLEEDAASRVTEP
jgi:glycosyltransferase involved in cell wall biosynthesis